MAFRAINMSMISGDFELADAAFCISSCTGKTDIQVHVFRVDFVESVAKSITF